MLSRENTVPDRTWNAVRKVRIEVTEYDNLVVSAEPIKSSSEVAPPCVPVRADGNRRMCAYKKNTDLPAAVPDKEVTGTRVQDQNMRYFEKQWHTGQSGNGMFT